MPVTSERKPFRSWVEDYVPDKGWKYDYAAYRVVRAQQANYKRLAVGDTQSTNAAKIGYVRAAAANIANEAAARAHRGSDSFERAKSFLQRRVPVYAASVAGGDAGKFVVGSKLVTADELIALATAKGWTA